MNNEQIELMNSFREMQNSSLYRFAQDGKKQIMQYGKSKDEIKRIIFDQLCYAAGWYGAKGPDNFPLPLDVFVYLRGKVENTTSDLYYSCRHLFTKYDNYDFADLVRTISKALVEWEDPNDIVAKTMFVATQILTVNCSEQDKDDLLMYLMQGTVIDNENTNPEGVQNCTVLWTYIAVYLDFEERLDRIISALIRNAGNN